MFRNNTINMNCFASCFVKGCLILTLFPGFPMSTTTACGVDFKKSHKRCDDVKKRMFDKKMTVAPDSGFIWVGDPEEKNVIASISQCVTLTCQDLDYATSASKYRSPTLIIQWKKYDINLPHNKKFIRFACTKRPFLYPTRLQIQDVQLQDSGVYWCEVRRNDTGEVVEARKFHVLIKNNENNSWPIFIGKPIAENKRAKVLNCSYMVNGNTATKVLWLKDGKEKRIAEPIIEVCSDGVYKCVVSNNLGKFEHTFVVSAEAINCRSFVNPWFIPVVVVFLLLLASGLIRCLPICFFRQKVKNTALHNKLNYGMYIESIEDIYEKVIKSEDVASEEEIKLSPPTFPSAKDNYLPMEVLSQQLPKAPVISEDDIELVKVKEVPREKITCELKNNQAVLLGSGFYGSVYKGYLKSDDEGVIPVAVKVLKDGSRLIDLKHFIEEAATLIKAEGHVNVISLVGTCIVDTLCSQDCKRSKKIPILLMEMANGGNLRSYLLQYRSNDIPSTSSSQSMSTSSIGYNELVDLAYQVALGMEHLTNRKILHRDLAARNVLLTEDKVVKIGDFGLSKHLIRKDYYRILSRWEKPAKWNSPEALKFDKYTVWSDVWSFGVLVWEIFTLGCEPYPTVASKDLYQYLQHGLRLPKPDLAKEDLYDSMLSCWNWLPEDRPSFKRLSHDFRSLLQEAKELADERQDAIFSKCEAIATERLSKILPNRNFSPAVNANIQYQSPTIQSTSSQQENVKASTCSAVLSQYHTLNIDLLSKCSSQPINASGYDVFDSSDQPPSPAIKTLPESGYTLQEPNDTTALKLWPKKFENENSLRFKNRKKDGLILENHSYVNADQTRNERCDSLESPVDSEPSNTSDQSDAFANLDDVKYSRVYSYSVADQNLAEGSRWG